ncbi:hypothetical protein CsSME_00019640 [Camellia sinensis var. sinensis]
MVDELANVLEHCEVVAREALTSGWMNSMEVDKEVDVISGTVVAESAGVLVKELEIEDAKKGKRWELQNPTLWTNVSSVMIRFIHLGI